MRWRNSWTVDPTAPAQTVELLRATGDVVIEQRTAQAQINPPSWNNGAGMDAGTLPDRTSVWQLGTRLGDGRVGNGADSEWVCKKRIYPPNAAESMYGAGRKAPDFHALHGYIDLDEIAEGQLDAIPRPEAAAVPSCGYRQPVVNDQCTTGTLVVWTKIDKVLADIEVTDRQLRGLDRSHVPQMAERWNPRDPFEAS